MIATKKYRLRPDCQTSASEMQNANQRKQATGCVIINISFAHQSFLQNTRTFIMDASARHVDCFYLTWGQ
jgi:hypothetical protein